MRLAAYAVIAMLVTSCVHVVEPPMPVGPVTPAQITAYQDALVAAQAEARRKRIVRSRIGVWLCTCADIATTLYAVRHDDNLTEGNPFVPDPKEKPLAFVGFKLSLGALTHWAAGRGDVKAAWGYSGALCGAAAWNVYQIAK